MWNGIEQGINLRRGTQTYKVFIAKDAYLSDDTTTISLGVTLELFESRTFVPYTFFETILEADVIIEGNTIEMIGYIDYFFDLDELVGISDVVADVPTNYREEDFYEYKFELTESPIDNMNNAIRIQGSNHSDDMFMGFYKKIDGLIANEAYIYKLSFDLGTSVPKGMSGIGGSPGSSVYVKAGIVAEVPSVEVDPSDYYRLSNVDKSNQSQSGKDLVVVTDMEKESNDRKSKGKSTCD